MKKNAPKVLIVSEDGFDPMFGSAGVVLSWAYSEAVSASGGIPITALDIRVCPEYLELADALLLTGGGAIHPSRYKGIVADFSELDGYSNTRDDLDFTLADLFVKAGKPVLGIGRGAMVINALLGGNIEKHLPELPEISTDTLSGGLKDLMGESVSFKRVYTCGLKELAAPLKAEAISSEGVIDGFSHESLPVKGVTWHPERELGGIPADYSLYKWLVESAKK